MADLYVLTELKAFLITNAIGQDYNQSPSQTLPAVWVDPFDGAPIPRDGELGTISLVDTISKAPSIVEGWIEEAYVDIIIRHRSPQACRQLHRQIKDLLVPNDSLGGRKDWDLNDLHVEYSTQWKGEQPLPYPTDGDTDLVSRVASYCFGCRRKALAGHPLTP